MKKLITKFYKGEIPLWKSYWLVGELLNALFILIIFNLEIYLFKNNFFSNSFLFLDFGNFSLFSKFFLILWTFYITVGIWRAAENYKGSIIWIIAVFLFLSYRVFSLRLIFFN
tara:strand:+ start:84 stop:422 length:339 start_codon:yes stop_codon:yes gene_type:complete